MLKSAYEGLNARPKVYLSKEYFCEMYPTFVSSKLCEFIFLLPLERQVQKERWEGICLFTTLLLTFQFSGEFVCLLETSRSFGSKREMCERGVCLLTTRLLIDLLALGKEGTATVSPIENKICLTFRRQKQIQHLQLEAGPIRSNGCV